MAGNGSRELAELAARARALGARDVRLQMIRGLKAAAGPVVQDLRVTAVNVLPKHGGLNELVANEKIKVQVRTSPRTAGVRVTTPDTLRNATNQGWIRHKVFGEWRANTPTQEIPAARGWWDRTIEMNAGQANAEALKLLAEIGAELIGRL